MAHRAPRRPPERAPLPLKAGLAERLRVVLVAEIERGRWPAQLPSERQLSREFQVSRPTLHNALQALEREGLLRQRGTPHWWITTPVATAPVAPRRAEVLLLRDARVQLGLNSLLPLTNLLRERLHALGFGLTVVDLYATGRRQVARRLAAIEAEYRPAFYLLASLPPVVHRWFEAQRLPALIFGTRAPGIGLPAIDIDPEATIRHAVEYLARRGHRRVGLLDLPVNRTVGAEKLYAAFHRCCAAAKPPVTGLVRNSHLRGGQLEQSLDRLVGAAPPVTALIVTDLELVLGVYTILGEWGRRIPQQVSVLSFYYWPILEALRPLPTGYRYPWENIAKLTLRVLMSFTRLGVLSNRSWQLLPTFQDGRSVAPRPLA